MEQKPRSFMCRGLRQNRGDQLRPGSVPIDYGQPFHNPGREVSDERDTIRKRRRSAHACSQATTNAFGPGVGRIEIETCSKPVCCILQI
jgi:hypothetical protein